MNFEEVSVREVCEALNISIHTLRKWERDGLIDIPRSRFGRRVMDEQTYLALQALLAAKIEVWKEQRSRTTAIAREARAKKLEESKRGEA